jgi:hypothetical protein
LIDHNNMPLTRRQALLNLALGVGISAVEPFAAAQTAPIQRVASSSPTNSELAQALQSIPDTANVEDGTYRLLVNASTNQRLGVPFRLSVAVLRLGRRDRYRGPVTFRCTDPKATLPVPYQFSSKDDLYESHLFEVTLQTEGQHVVTVREEELGTEFASNVIVASNAEPKLKLYFGDIHIHSQWSVDGRLEPDYSYLYCRDALNLDFACMTEHDPSDYVWEMVKAKAKELYQPGRFATMSAYEWTAHDLHEGHKNVYYRDWDGPILRSPFFNRGNTTSAKDLWAKLRKAGKSGKTAMTLPHHPAAKIFPVPWDHYDSEFQRCVEVYSTWGNSETPTGPRQIKWELGPAPGHFVQDGLAAGQRLGFVGGSDSHSSRPGYPAHSSRYYDADYQHWEPNLYTGGTTGVYAEELTREAIFDAIQSRRCYATTGKRIIVHFKADDHWMGEEYESRNAPHLYIKVLGTAPIASVTIVKNGQDHFRMEGNGQRELEFEYGKTTPPEKTDYYYVRVIQEDSEMAWASPIWISRG